MKRTVYMVTLILLAGLSAAVVGGPESGEDGEVGITSSNSASTTVTEDGVQWEAELGTVNSSCMSGEQEEGIHGYETRTEEANGEVIQRGVSFTGSIETPNPCYTTDYEIVEEEENVYTMNIVTESEDMMCVECVGIIEYQADFDTEEGFVLHVEHDGDQVETIEHGDYEGDTGTTEPEQGFFSSLTNWFRSLF